MNESPSPAAGWYLPTPTSPLERYWDGNSWQDYYRQSGAANAYASLPTETNQVVRVEKLGIFSTRLSVDRIPGFSVKSPVLRARLARVLPLLSAGITVVSLVCLVYSSAGGAVVSVFFATVIAGAGVWSSWEVNPRKWRSFAWLMMIFAVMLPFVLFLVALIVTAVNQQHEYGFGGYY